MVARFCEVGEGRKEGRGPTSLRGAVATAAEGTEAGNYAEHEKHFQPGWRGTEGPCRGARVNHQVLGMGSRKGPRRAGVWQTQERSRQ